MKAMNTLKIANCRCQAGVNQALKVMPYFGAGDDLPTEGWLSMVIGVIGKNKDPVTKSPQSPNARGTTGMNFVNNRLS
jgi:hypothetical protein